MDFFRYRRASDSDKITEMTFLEKKKRSLYQNASIQTSTMKVAYDRPILLNYSVTLLIIEFDRFMVLARYEVDTR